MFPFSDQPPPATTHITFDQTLPLGSLKKRYLFVYQFGRLK